MSSPDSADARVRRRYRWLASAYDYGLGERLFYAAARRRAVELLKLQLRVSRDTDEATTEQFTWGYVGVGAGTLRA